MTILNRVKQLEIIGHAFEGAEVSMDIMILHATKGYCPPFVVVDDSSQVFDDLIEPEYRRLVVDANGEKDDARRRKGAKTHATVTARTIDDGIDSADNDVLCTDRLEVSNGTDTVDALTGALKRAMVPTHPAIENVEFDYKVRILVPESATRGATRVMIEFKDRVTDMIWTTVSVDNNTILCTH